LIKKEELKALISNKSGTNMMEITLENLKSKNFPASSMKLS
jgi:hypothetical protein